MNDKLLNILKVIETLNADELKKVGTWVDFVLDKKENPQNIVFVKSRNVSP